MLYKRMPIEIESPEEYGYNQVKFNLSESSMLDLKFGDLGLSLDSLDLSYIAHRGKAEFRELLAAEYGQLKADDILISNGAAGAIFIVNTAILSSADHLIVVRPNYATNIEVPRGIGAEISFIDLSFDDEWKLNPENIIAAIKPNTKLISITTPHNPTGMLMEESAIDLLIRKAEEKKIMLLVDETYRDTCFKTPYPLLASKSEQVISISSLSKAFGLPGLRIGWLVTKNRKWMEIFFAAKEMIYINNSALDEEVAYQFYQKKEQFSNSLNNRALENFAELKKWLSHEARMELVLPKGGVVCFPRFKTAVPVNTPKFYDILLNRFQTMVGAGHWFEMPDTYMRIGFGWNDKANFSQGLRNISRAIDLSV